jgi:hypothetical protein
VRGAMQHGDFLAHTCTDDIFKVFYRIINKLFIELARPFRVMSPNISFLLL